MNSIVICIGSNSHDREWQMEHAIEWLRKQLSSTRISSIYNTQAENRRDPDYLNAVLEGHCKTDFETISKEVKEYETVCGRTPTSKLQGNIPMDLDIIMWNGEIMRPDDYKKTYFQIGWQELNK